MNPNLSVRTLAVCAPLVLAGAAQAQWSDDSTMHQVIADGSGEQVQPKIAPTGDGGCYISWYTSDAGYDVRLQYLDDQGVPQWPANGILIADRGYSSTQDYDLDVDASGYAIIAFRDDRFGADQITAQRVGPDGSIHWGANGIQFGDTAAFLATPDVATTSDGGAVIAWGSDSVTEMAKVDETGSVLWTHTISEDGLTTLVASMHGTDNGSVVVSWIQYAFFLGQKTLHAQKIDASGNEAWASRVAVYDGGSLQFGNFPEFVASPDGSTTFSWYDTQNSLNVYVQRLGSDGIELFGHNGVAASVAPGERVSPSVTFDDLFGETYVSWVELANNQGHQGVYAQAFDSKGSRLWGDSGVALTAPDANSSGSINVQVLDGNLVTLWIEGGGGIGSDVVNSTRLDDSGAEVWSTQVASDPAYRARLASAVSGQQIIAAWQIGDFGVADIEAHNLNEDGTLGVIADCPADLTGDGMVNFFDVSAFLNAFNAMDPVADFTGDGVLNFFDISLFLQAYNAGCP